MHLFALTAGAKALALQEKEINPSGPVYVRLVGRQSGIVDWFLTLLGVNTTSILEVYADRIEYSHGSLSGDVVEMIPLSNISNVICGYLKPVLLLIAGIISALLGIFVLIGGVLTSGSDSEPLIIFGSLQLIFAVIFIVFYNLRKSVLISIIPNSASATGILFKRSLIENLTLSRDEAVQIIYIINYLVALANKKS